MIVGSLGLFLLTVAITIVVPRKGPRQRKHSVQRTAAGDFFGTASGDRLEVDWFQFGEVPKQELVTIASEYHWQFKSDQITDSGWILRFTKVP